MDSIEKPIALIVEDNAQLLMIAEAMVEEAGWAVLTVSNSDDAVAVLQARSDVRALFTDVQIPGTVNGVRLAYLVHERWPGIRLIITSGWSSLQTGDLPPGSIFLTKPYDPQKVQASLGAFAAAS